MLVLNLISCSMYVSSLKHVMILLTLFKVIFMAGKALNARLLPVGVVLYCQTGSSFEIDWTDPMRVFCMLWKKKTVLD